MLNIQDFGGFAGIAKLIQEVKETGKKLDDLYSNTGVSEIGDLKTKYLDALDQFRPGNTEGVSSVADDFPVDAKNVMEALQTKITDKGQLEEATQTFNECKDTTTHLLGIVMNALRKAS